MKNIVIYIFAFLIVTIAGCSLDEEPTSFVNTDTYYKTKEQIVSGLNSTYIPLKAIYNYTYLIVTEGVTDLMNIHSGTLDAQLDISPSNPRFGRTMWQQGYKGVMYCNSIIAAIKRSPLKDEDTKNQLLAEGMVMRAYYYWFLTSTFGDVPFYTEDISTTEVQSRVAKLGRMSADSTRDSLIRQLQRVVPYLPQIRTYDIPDHRAGAAMGWMLIGKMAQWNHEWDIARDAMDKLEAIYGNLNQYPIEDIAFSVKNAPESIFEVQHTYSTTGLQVTTNTAAICMPHRDSGDVYNGVQIPELGDQATTYTALRPNNYFFQAVQPKQVHDLRLDLNMAWSYKGVTFKSTSSVPWLGPKFWSYDMFNVSDGNNQPVFRYADALLMQAENYMELEDKDKSIKYLNMVRRRAELSDYVFKNRDLLREEIQKERGRELLGEYQRKYDLVRWGIWYQQTYDYTDYGSLKNNMLPCHKYYPIPDVEINKSGGALDNDDYDKYGLN